MAGHCSSLRLRSWLAALVLCAAAMAGPAPAEAAITNAAAVSAIYGRILNAEFDQASALISTCDGIPREACSVLEATRVWWRIQLDPYSRALDGEFSKKIDAAIAACEAWTAREPRRAEAWFYLGAAYGARVQWRVLRVERLAAARDGKRIKESLERALALDPDLEDAHFGIGLYKYYADVAPAVLRVLRFLLMLPGGDREEGLRQMQRTRERGAVLAGEADYQLHIIDLWYEENFARARSLVEGLASRYPRNPLFLQLAGEIEDVYFHDASASLRAYETLAGRARRGRVHEAALAEVVARVGAARALEALDESDRALELLGPVLEAGPRAPATALGEARAVAASAHARLGETRRAAEERAAARRAIPPGDPRRLGDYLDAVERRRITPAGATAYRLSLEGWRLYQRKELARAEAALAAAAKGAPENGTIRYRHAHVVAARDRTRAIPEYEAVLTMPRRTNPVYFAAACVELAAIVEPTDPGRAKQLYTRATQVFGADARLKAQAARRAEQIGN